MSGQHTIGKPGNARQDTIMIAYDGSENADRAIDYAGRFLRSHTAFVVTAWESGVHQSARLSALSGGMQPVLHSVVDQGIDDALHNEARDRNTRGVTRATAAGLHAEGRLAEVDSTVWAALVDAADTLEVDILVTGTSGSSGLRALLHSSVSEHVLKHCHRPVLVVPAGCARRNEEARALRKSKARMVTSHP
jgi:nucleotide-binding universal stress UspA family protein